MANCGSWLEKDVLQDTFSNSWTLVPRREDQVPRKELGRTCRTSSSAGLHQAAQPQLKCSAVASLHCWLGRAGGRDQLQGSMRASHAVQQVVNGKQALTGAHSGAKNVAKTEAHYFLRHQRSRAKAATAYYFTPGRSCFQAALLGDSHCPLPTWCTASNPPLAPFQSARAAALRSLWLHSLVFHPPLTIPRKGKHTFVQIMATWCYKCLFMLRACQGQYSWINNWKWGFRFKLPTPSFAQKFNLCLLLLEPIKIFQHSKYQRTFRGEKKKKQHCYCFFMLLNYYYVLNSPVTFKSWSKCQEGFFDRLVGLNWNELILPYPRPVNGQGPPHSPRMPFTCLPPRVHEGAAPFSHHMVEPLPSFVVDGLSH